MWGWGVRPPTYLEFLAILWIFCETGAPHRRDDDAPPSLGLFDVAAKTHTQTEGKSHKRRATERQHLKKRDREAGEKRFFDVETDT